MAIGGYRGRGIGGVGGAIGVIGVGGAIGIQLTRWSSFLGFF